MSGQEQNINELKKVRLEKLQELRDMGIDLWGKYERSAMAQQIIDDFNALEGKSVKIAGRIMSKRGMVRLVLPTFKIYREGCSSISEKMIWAKNSMSCLKDGYRRYPGYRRKCSAPRKVRSAYMLEV